MAFVSGAVFLASSLLYNRATQGTTRALILSHVLIATMLSLTAISQFHVIPKMDAILAAAGELSSLPANSPLHQQWDSLHAWSTRLEGTVLILGLIVLYATTRRFNPSRQ
jgi:hypothetical protein